VDTQDRRLTRIRLTERGEALRKELPAALDAVAAQGLSRLDKAEREQLVTLLGKAAAGFRPTA
jgi:DNA-binding MarR family transcriptional regulator